MINDVDLNVYIRKIVQQYPIWNVENEAENDTKIHNLFI